MSDATAPREKAFLLALTALGVDASLRRFGVSLTLLDLVGAGASCAMAVAVSARAIGNLRVLALREPVAPYTPAP